MTKLFRILPIIAVTLGCNPPKPPEAAPPAAATPAMLKVTAVRVAKKTLVRTSEQPAQIAPMETTPLVSKVAGYVQEVKKDIGDAVAKDEVLVVLTAPELIEEVKQKDAQVKQAASGIEQARAAVRVAEANVAKTRSLQDELKAGIARAQAELDRRKTELDRVVELTEKGALTESRRSEAESDAKVAAAALEEARAKLAASEASIAAAEAEVAQTAADLQASESQQSVAAATLGTAQKMADYLVIKSPYDGFITERNIDTGHFVSPAGSAAAKPLLVVVRADKVRVFVEVPEYDARYVGPGDKATLRIEALGNKTLSEGVTVTRTALGLDPKSGTLRTEIDLDNPKGELRPGLYANVQIELDRRDGVAALPTTAVFNAAGKPTVVVVENGRGVHRPVQTGLSAGGEVEIVEGLKEGELVVAKNGATIADGQSLEAVEAK